MDNNDSNTGAGNTGKYNTGIGNAGSYNTGIGNTGHYNSGDYNAGSCNTGRFNAGDFNAGSCNTGNYNSGNWNSGSYNAGSFNSIHQSPLLFNKPIDQIVFANIEFPDYMYSVGLNVENYKDDWATSWSHAGEDEKLATISLPNFDPEVFLEITGIDVRREKFKGNAYLGSE